MPNVTSLEDIKDDPVESNNGIIQREWRRMAAILSPDVVALVLVIVRSVIAIVDTRNDD